MEEEETEDAHQLSVEATSRHWKRRKLHRDDDDIADRNNCAESVLKTSELQKSSSCPATAWPARPQLLHNFFLNLLTEDKKVEKAAVIYDSGKGIVESISCNDLHNAANFVKDLLEEERFCDSDFIGVGCELGIMYPAIILGILWSGKAFFNIDPQNVEEAVDAGASHLGLRYVICEEAWEPYFSHKPFAKEKVAEISVSEIFRKICIFEVSNSHGEPSRDSGLADTFAYAIQTSGTTGRKKTVLVPHNCICPNIFDFIHTRWNLTSQDVIFGCAPPTFDPHIVELFTALAVGGTIVYTASSVKLNPSLLAGLMINHRVTILQITPSVFRKVYAHFANCSEYLSLRIVAFGGEKCPTKSELRAMKESVWPLSEFMFQNIYGVTEMSCWASVSTIDLRTDNPITIGEGILETEVRLDEATNEIIISSPTRHCIILDPSQEKSHRTNSPTFEYNTGDLGRVDSDGIIFEGRIDRVVKRNGMKVPLCEIEEMTLTTGLVSFAECILYRSKIWLLVQLKPEFKRFEKLHAASNILLPSLSKSLDIPLFMYPDFTVALNVLPLNSNGKLDFKSVIDSLKLVKERNSDNVSYPVSEDQVVKTVEPIWRSCTWPGIRPMEALLKENFVDAGGDSISAARFVETAFLSLKLFGSDIHERYEQEVKQMLTQGTFQSVVGLICKMVSCSGSLSTNFRKFTDDLIEVQEQLLPNPHTVPSMHEFENEMLDSEAMLDDDDSSSVFNKVKGKYICSPKIMSPVQVITMYDFRLGLCVDASPSVVNGGSGEKVIVGCHGGILLCVDLPTLRCNSWKRKFPARLEGSVATGESCLYGYVGCHDCNFYKFSIANGDIIGYASCSAPIRSKSAISDELEVVVFVDSGNSIYCANYHSMNIVWVQTSYKLLATYAPVVWRNLCFLSTLTKGLIALDIQTGREIWNSSNTCNYSSPTLVHFSGKHLGKHGRKSHLVVAALLTSANTEKVEARDAMTGRVEWRYDATTSTPHPTVSQPFYNKCCDKIIWTSLSDFRLKSLSPQNGNCMHNLVSGFVSANEVNVSCVLESIADVNRTSKCILFYKIHGMNQLMFVNLHDNKSFLVRPWFIMRDFESFSAPVSTNEFIVFGGRDNKLHIIKCKVR